MVHRFWFIKSFIENLYGAIIQESVSFDKIRTPEAKQSLLLQQIRTAHETTARPAAPALRSIFRPSPAPEVRRGDRHASAGACGRNLKAAIRSIDADDSVLRSAAGRSASTAPRRGTRARRLLAAPQPGLCLTTGNPTTPSVWTATAVFSARSGTDHFCLTAKVPSSASRQARSSRTAMPRCPAKRSVAGRTMRRRAADGRRRPPYARPD